MQHEAACDKICDDIATLLLDVQPPTRQAIYAAARATRDVAAALHHAAGDPANSRWRDALVSVERFLDASQASLNEESTTVLELRAFVEENADLLAPRFERAQFLTAS